jgi:hypothetical protein
MEFAHPVTKLINQRYSCRDYCNNMISKNIFTELNEFINALPNGPFNAASRFQLVAASEEDNNALRGLGTYGTIKNPPGYLIGVTREADKHLEDFGYRMESIVLRVTDLNLTTCWLGGFFTRSGFSKKISAVKGETIPAVCSVGIPSVVKTAPEIEFKRSRLGWSALFFENEFGSILSPEKSAAYALPLEMVRLAPSAQNKQPWRIIKQGKSWHFYLQRSKGYREMVLPSLTGIADLQRLDMGIAMAHFELTAREAGLDGRWLVSDPGITLPDKLTEYTVTWDANHSQNP